MSNSKDKGMTAVKSISAIKKMKTADEINKFISGGETRKTVLDAARERIQEINTPKPVEVIVEPVESEEVKAETPPAVEKTPPVEKTKAPKPDLDEFEAGQSLGRVHDRENYEKGKK